MGGAPREDLGCEQLVDAKELELHGVATDLRRGIDEVEAALQIARVIARDLGDEAHRRLVCFAEEGQPRAFFEGAVCRIHGIRSYAAALKVRLSPTVSGQCSARLGSLVLTVSSISPAENATRKKNPSLRRRHTTIGTIAACSRSAVTVTERRRSPKLSRSSVMPSAVLAETRCETGRP